MHKLRRAYHTSLTVLRMYLSIDAKLSISIFALKIIEALNTIVNSYLFALLIGAIVDALTQREIVVSKLMPLIIFLVSYQALIQLIDIAHGYLENNLRLKDIPALRVLASNHLISLGISQMENPELTNRSTRFNEMSAGIYDYLSLFFSLLASIIATTVSLFIFLKIMPLFSLLILVVFIFKFLVNQRFMRELWLIRRESTEDNRRAYGTYWNLTDPAMLKEILITGGVKMFTKKLMDFVNDFNAKHIGIRRKWMIFEVSYVFIDMSLYGYGLFSLISKSISQALSISAVTFYGRSLFTLVSQLNTLSYRVSRVVEQSIRIEDAIELFEKFSPGKDGTRQLSKNTAPPSIEFRDVSFAYPNGRKKVIENLNLKIKPGERIAIVGENGAGKTTLVKLLTRFYEPQTGTIELDSIPLSNLAIKSWYHKIGTLFQDYNAYGSLTVKENVGIAKSLRGGINTSRVWAALKKADADKFVKEYPKQLDQTLSERFKGGIRPSGGQWQKIAIARVFYRSAPVLILDEPTASIDAVSEAQIFDNIYKFMKGKTVIIISHRFSTVRNADRILVLDKGKVIEDGSHEHLMKLNGKYAHAFNLQAKGYN